MPDDTLAQDEVQDAGGHERLLVLAAYGLYLMAVFNGVTLLIGAAMAWVRLGHAKGAVAQSHYRNMLRVFWTVAGFAAALIVLAVAGMWDVAFTSAWSAFTLNPWPLMHLPFWAMLAPLAALVSFVLGIWYLWRAGRGFVLALDEKPY